MHLSKNNIKYIRSLGEKKFRNRHNTFVAEGEKLVFDLMQTCSCQLLASLPEILVSYPEVKAEAIIEASEAELKKASFLKTAPPVIAVFYIPEYEVEDINLDERLTLVMDNIQDPGNLGTIVRVADWFGIDYIICSNDSADVYNPKTVQASMGSLARVKVVYTDIANYLSEQKGFPVYGTYLYGENIYEADLTDNGLIVMGNEGKGISSNVGEFINSKLFIPNFPTGNKTSESLNVATATAIVCSEFRRRIIAR